MRTIGKKLFYSSFCVLFACVCITGCGGEGDEGDGMDTVATSTGSDSEIGGDQINKAKKIFYMLPSPIETASLLKKAGASYNKEFLNPVANLSKYETVKSKSLNLGIYGTDLSYTSIFDQTQESMIYVSCAKRLADDLGVTRAFDEGKMNRIEENIHSKDSMLNIISDSYWVANAYLKDNDRANISALIIAGGWVEGLYLATRLAKNDAPNPDIIKRIAEQKYSIEHLVELIDSYEKDINITEVLNDLNKLKAIFDELEVVSTPGENTIDPETGVTTIGATKEIQISDDQLSSIIATIEEIRNKYIEP